jgi:hypothetical protein
MAGSVQLPTRFYGCIHVLLPISYSYGSMEPKIPLERPSADAPPLQREEIDQLAATPYRSLVMSMMYIALGTRPDIAFVVMKLAQFLDCYSAIHWQAAISVLRYLKGTREMSLTLGGTLTHCSLWPHQLRFHEQSWMQVYNGLRLLAGLRGDLLVLAETEGGRPLVNRVGVYLGI